MNEIINNLNKVGSFYKFNGIVSCVKSGNTSPEIIGKLKELKEDNSQIAGHKIADFSIAALDILGIEKYTGKDTGIIGLINSRLDF